METTWQLQHAKNRFSELVQKALTEGPQTVTRYGNDAVIVISISHYREILDKEDDFKQFLETAPLEDVHLVRE